MLDSQLIGLVQIHCKSFYCVFGVPYHWLLSKSIGGWAMSSLKTLLKTLKTVMLQLLWCLRKPQSWFRNIKGWTVRKMVENRMLGSEGVLFCADGLLWLHLFYLLTSWTMWTTLLQHQRLNSWSKHCNWWNG